MAITAPIAQEASYKSWYKALEKAYAEYFDQMGTGSTPTHRQAPLFTTPCPTSGTVDAQVLNSPKVSPKIRSAKRKAEATSTHTPAVAETEGEYISPEEKELRVAEANILFPKYMDRYKTKRTKSSCPRRQSGDQKLSYLPSEEYAVPWEPEVYECAPSMEKRKLTRTLEYFQQDCRKPGSSLAKNGPNPIESDPLYYDLEWNQRWNPLEPELKIPPQKGSLAVFPSLSTRKVPNPLHRSAYDSFVLELKKEMGTRYIDPQELRYYSRSDGRATPFWDEKSKKYKALKNAKYDLELCFRNRDIARCVSAVKILYEIRGIRWNDDLAEEWDKRIVRFVDPRTVCEGRSYYSEERELGIEHEKYASPEPVDPKIIAPPAGMDDDDLGKQFYWSEKERRMVSMEEMRQKRKDTQESDMMFRSSPVVQSEGISTRSKSMTFVDMRQRGAMNPFGDKVDNASRGV